METYDMVLKKHNEKPENERKAYEEAYTKLATDETAKEEYLERQARFFFECDDNENGVLEFSEY